MDDRTRLNLPVRPFLYTLDQVATILSMTEASLVKSGYCFFTGRVPGRAHMDELCFINLEADPKAKPNWRVEERELIRWMKRKGFRYVDR